MTTAVSEFVTLAVEDRIAVITIDRPKARNAINADVARGIEAAIDRIEDDPDLWIGILTATPPVFCAGADLKEVGQGNARSLATERGGFGGLVRRERTKPLIAAVDGAALAGGAELTLACDLIVASHRARFGIPEVSRGLVAEAGGLFRLGRKIPLNLAMEAALTGEPIPAAVAFQHGLVNRLCEDGQTLDTALELARRVCVNAPLAVRASRAVVLEATWAPDSEAWHRSRQAFAQIKESADVKEGVDAFIEKRPPRWTAT